MRRRIRLCNKLKNGRQSDRGAEERDGPDAENLVHCDVKTKGLGVIGYPNKILARGLSRLQRAEQSKEMDWLLPMLSMFISMRGLMILYQR